MCTNIQVYTYGYEKVVVADDVIVQAKTEALVDIFIERTEEDNLDKDLHYLLEATDEFTERYELSMAWLLVDLNQAVTSKVRI